MTLAVPTHSRQLHLQMDKSAAARQPREVRKVGVDSPGHELASAQDPNQDTFDFGTLVDMQLKTFFPRAEDMLFDGKRIDSHFLDGDDI